MMAAHLESVRLAVISPHYDDAVLGCGNLMAGHADCTVLTVCSGVPDQAMAATEWDRRCGFDSSWQAMQIRRAENAAALSILGVEHVGLGLLDHQYQQRAAAPNSCVSSDVLRQALLAELSRIAPDATVFPLGLFHEDHVNVADACLHVSETLSSSRWFAYSDVLYRTRPGLMQERLAALFERGIAATPVLLTATQHAKKTLAVAAYSSQLNALGLTPGAGDDAAPELYWELNASPDAKSVRKTGVKPAAASERGIFLEGDEATLAFGSGLSL